MIKKIALGVVCFYALTFFIPQKTEPDTTPPDEPPLQMAPLPVIEKVDTPHFEPILEPESPQKDSNIICTDDCPLIEAKTAEDAVRAYYADIPVMIAIARCESQFRQYNEQGEVLMNSKGSSATGVMQIMASVHREEAERHGMDIDTLEGNMAYARMLYEKRGTKPWSSSKTCWNTQLAVR